MQEFKVFIAEKLQQKYIIEFIDSNDIGLGTNVHMYLRSKDGNQVDKFHLDNELKKNQEDFKQIFRENWLHFDTLFQQTFEEEFECQETILI